MTTEGLLIKRMLLWATTKGWRLGRNSKGGAYTGQLVAQYNASGRNGSLRMVSLKNARFLHFGLLFGKGGGESDLIGWRTLRITPEMIGTRVAQFVAAELKTPNVRTTTEQRNFLAQVRKAGGLGLVVRDRAGELVMDEGKKEATT
ncbi:MAG TPA: hypothetical protein VM487_16150 [Phycisphaerae bacterium]|nr:hypothetical protein [Phycisphaerae bacterium]